MSDEGRLRRLLDELKTPDDRRPSEHELRYTTISTHATAARVRAAFALGKMGDARAVEPLIAALEDWSSEVLVAAACALADIGDLRAAAAIERALASEQGHHASNSLRASLLSMGHPDSAGSLLAALDDQWVAYSAVQGLQALLKREPGALSDDQLKKITGRARVIQLQDAWDYRELANAREVDIDIANMRWLAAEELKRRGLKIDQT
jgi:HEAT repeat protein